MAPPCRSVRLQARPSLVADGPEGDHLRQRKACAVFVNLDDVILVTIAKPLGCCALGLRQRAIDRDLGGPRQAVVAERNDVGADLGHLLSPWVVVMGAFNAYQNALSSVILTKCVYFLFLM